MKMKDPQEFTIKRSEWYRGQGNLDSRLLRVNDRTRCCLGFYLQACGYPDKDLLDLPFPSALPYDHNTQLLLPYDWLFATDGPFLLEKEIAGINDSPAISEQERERLLADFFKEKKNITIHFVD